jgi:hypothetical protein
MLLFKLFNFSYYDWMSFFTTIQSKKLQANSL